MKTGSVKRLAVLAGVAVMFVAIVLLTSTVQVGEIECGSAVNAANRHVPEGTYTATCDGPIARQRWIGGALLAAGTVAVVVGNPRSLMSPD
jgi:hypothetical protein